MENLKKNGQFVTICYDVVTTSAQGALVVTIRYDSLRIVTNRYDVVKNRNKLTIFSSNIPLFYIFFSFNFFFIFFFLCFSFVFFSFVFFIKFDLNFFCFIFLSFFFFFLHLRNQLKKNLH